MPELNKFVGAMKSGGARANQFSVGIAGRSPAVTNEMSFMCRSAQIPALTMGEIAVPYRGRQIFVPGDRTYDAWTVTIYNDTNFSIRDDMERWQNSIQDIGNSTKDGNSFPYRSATVKQQDRSNRTIRSYKLYDVWPTTVDAIDLAFDTNDVIEEFGVTFRFNYMVVVPHVTQTSTRATSKTTSIGAIPGDTATSEDKANVWIDPDAESSVSGSVS